jgi:methanogenic corrinoid protein MtbC1
MIDNIYQDFLSSLIHGNRSRCTFIVQDLIENDLPIERIYTELFQHSLYEIGDLWEQNRISVAVEHMATGITENLLSLLYPHVLSRRVPVARKAVISCSVNEYHQVGARMVADIMDSHGWDAWFLGANTPVEDLLTLIQDKQPDVLGLSVSIYFNVIQLKNAVDIVRSNYPHLDIFVGGQAFRWGGTDMISSFDNVTYIPSLEALTKTIQPGKIE